MTAITNEHRSTEQMSEFTIDDLYRATVDDSNSIGFAASVGLLPNRRPCERCCRSMHLVSRQENIDKKRWICKITEGKTKKYCSTKSIRSGTFFEKSHLSIRTILHILYWWSLGFPPSLIGPLCGVTLKCATDFGICLRHECEKRGQHLGHQTERNSNEDLSAKMEQRFREEANGAVFARIIDAIHTSFGIVIS